MEKDQTNTLEKRKTRKQCSKERKRKKGKRKDQTNTLEKRKTRKQVRKKEKERKERERTRQIRQKREK